MLVSFFLYVLCIFFIFLYPYFPPPLPPRIATFASLRQSQAESDEEEGQAFYAGGSERRLNILL